MKKNFVRKTRVSRGISQLKLAAITGIAPGTISNIENKKIVAYPGWRKRIAKALKATESELFPGYTKNEKEVE